MKSSNRIWQILAVIYLIIFMTIVILAYNRGLPTFLTVNDKAGHIGLYGLATFLGHRATNRRSLKLGSRTVPFFPLLFGIFTVVEESCQALSPNRTFDLFDLAASFFGILVGYGLAERGRPRSTRSRTGSK